MLKQMCHDERARGGSERGHHQPSLLKVFERLLTSIETPKTKKRPTKSQEALSPQPPKPKRHKLVKKHFEIPTSSAIQIEEEEEVHLDAEPSHQNAYALTIYSLPGSPFHRRPTLSSTFSKIQNETISSPISLPILELQPPSPPRTELDDLKIKLRGELLPPQDLNVELTLSLPHEK